MLDTSVRGFGLPEICFDAEVSNFLARQYVFVGHCSTIGRDRYRRVSIQGESILVARDNEGLLAAFANVCLHRGSRLTNHDEGDANLIRCPYHGWEYDAAGRLRTARLAEATQGTALPKIDLIEHSGMVFLALDPGQHDVFAKALSEVFGPLSVFDIENLKVAATKTFAAQVGWPLFVQNFVECYHCFDAHPLLRRSEAFIDLLESGAAWKIGQLDRATANRAVSNGKPIMALEPAIDHPVFRAAHTSTLLTDSETVDGTLLGKPLGGLPASDRSFTYGWVGPLVHFTLLPDQLVMFAFDPIANDGTNIRVTWMVHADTILDDTAHANMVDFWSRTIEEDIALTEAVQQNMGSRFMQRPRFTRVEHQSHIFTEWLKKEIEI